MNKYFMLAFLLDLGGLNDAWAVDYTFGAKKAISPIINKPVEAVKKGGEDIKVGLQYQGNKAIGGMQYQGNKAIGGLQYQGNKAIGGLQYQGNKAIGGLQYQGNKAIGGLQYQGNKAIGGLQYQGNKAIGGMQYQGNKASGGMQYLENQAKERTKATINNIDTSVMRNVDDIQRGAEYEYNKAAAKSQELGQQLQNYTREHPVDNEGLESAFEAAAAAKKNLGNSVKQFGIQGKKIIGAVESPEPAKAMKNFGAKVPMKNLEHVSNAVGGLEPSEVGRSIHDVGSKAIESIKKGDYWNAKEPVNAVGGLAAKVKPSMEKIGEGIGNIDKAQKKALEDLRKFDPDEIFGWVQQSLKENIDDELKRNGLAFNQETGELDLRNSRMGKTLLNWLEKFTQGNNAEQEIAVFTYNVNSRKLEVGLYARHRQSWKGGVDLYSVTQRAGFWYDFQSSSGDFEIDPGQLSPRFNSKTLKKLSEGDLVGIAETSSPTVIGKIVNSEHRNEYENRLSEFHSRYGADNVYFASKDFVKWATPATLLKYAVNGVLTLGESIYPQLMADLQERAESERPELTRWLEARGVNNKYAVANELLSGQRPKSPFLKFEIIPVRYSVREKPLNAITTEWRNVNHWAFVIVWTNGGGKESHEYDEIIDMVGKPQISPE